MRSVATKHKNWKLTTFFNYCFLSLLWSLHLFFLLPILAIYRLIWHKLSTNHTNQKSFIKAFVKLLASDREDYSLVSPFLQQWFELGGNKTMLVVESLWLALHFSGISMDTGRWGGACTSESWICKCPVDIFKQTRAYFVQRWKLYISATSFHQLSSMVDCVMKKWSALHFCLPHWHRL